jgi:hypothetical protein
MSESSSGWGRKFDAPIELPDGKRLATLRDAIRHLSETIPKRDHDHPRVVIAATVLTDAAERREFILRARIAVCNDQRLRKQFGDGVIARGFQKCSEGHRGLLGFCRRTT